MYSNSKNQFNSSAVAVTVMSLIVCLQTQSVEAQALSPLGDKSANSNSISEVYNLTKKAGKYDDFLVISNRCRELLTGELSDKDQKYLDSLLAWAENRLAGKELENANGLKSVGLHEQAQLEMQKAIKRYDDLVESHPDLWRAWMGRAVIHAQRGEYESAIEKFRNVLKLDIRNSKARFNIAEILYTQKKYEEAIAEYSKVLVDDATDVQALTGRGHCYSKLEQHSKAAEDFLTVTKLHPDSTQALSNLDLANRFLDSTSDQGPIQTLTSSKKLPDNSPSDQR